MAKKVVFEVKPRVAMLQGQRDTAIVRMDAEHRDTVRMIAEYTGMTGVDVLRKLVQCGLDNTEFKEQTRTAPVLKKTPAQAIKCPFAPKSAKEYSEEENYDDDYQTDY